MTPQALREDRILQEILATGGDVRRICDFFGIGIDAALRYTLVLTRAELEPSSSRSSAYETCLRRRRRAWEGPDVAILLGDKHAFAVEIGEDGDGLRRVDLWAAGQWLTCDDNMVFVAQFSRDVKDTAAWLRSGGGSPLPFSGFSPEACHRQLVQIGGESRSRFRALEWGPTTDNVTILLFRDGDRLALTFEFWREKFLLSHAAHAGKIFVMAISAAEFVGILDGLLAALDGGKSGRTRAGD